MQRLVLDTNVFVAAGFNPGSSAAAIVRAARDGACELVWNQATRRETQAVLRRIPHLDWEHVVPLFRPEWEHQGETHPESFSHVPDAEDRKFAALAAASGAILVSNDRHLLDHRGEGFQVSTPGDVVNALSRRA